MGTDISFFAERRTAEGAWDLIQSEFYFGNDRNYSMFAALAGVRASNREIPLLVEPRGMPDDLSTGGRESVLRRARHFQVSFEVFCIDDICHHSHSWLTLRELMDYPWHAHPATRATGDYLHQLTFPALREWGTPGNIRVIFWFDD